MAHRFVIPETASYWHHEWERCAECGLLDRPDEPCYMTHLVHDEDAEEERQERHAEHPAYQAMKAGKRVISTLHGWVVDPDPVS